MTFPVLLLVALIVRLTPWRAGLPFDLPLRWSRFLQPKVDRVPNWLIPALAVVPLLPLAWLLRLLEEQGPGVLYFFLQVILMLAAIGRSDPLGQFGRPFEQAWERGDFTAASLVAERELETAETAPALLDAMRGRLAWESLQAYFVPVFWFVLLGPLAALAYRLWWVAAQHLRGAHPTASLVHALEWVPLRLLGLALALVGQFDPTLQRLRELCGNWDVASRAAIQSCLLAALGPVRSDSALRPARRLLERTVLVWAVVIAFIELAG